MQEQTPQAREEKHVSHTPLLRLTLPLPPSINEQYATVNGRRVSTPVARRFKHEVKMALRTLERPGPTYTKTYALDFNKVTWHFCWISISPHPEARSRWRAQNHARCTL